MKLLGTRDLQTSYGISARTLEGWRIRGLGPPFVRLGGRVYYRRLDVESWIASNLRRRTADKPLSENNPQP
jgi:hypothetical protein